MSTRTIWKFQLDEVAAQSIVMPRAARILCVGIQGESVFLWAEVTPERSTEHRHFEIIGTGHPIDPNMEKKYLGTVFMPSGLVWHIFENQN